MAKLLGWIMRRKEMMKKKKVKGRKKRERKEEKRKMKFYLKGKAFGRSNTPGFLNIMNIFDLFSILYFI